MIIIIIKAELLIYAFTNAFTNLCIYLFFVKLFQCQLNLQSFKVQFLKNMAPFVQIRDCSRNQLIVNHLVMFVTQK